MAEDMALDTDRVLDAISRREAVIECLTAGPKHNRDIRDEIGVSRSTVYKALTELEELDVVRRGDDGHELTELGRLLFERYRSFHSEFEDICASGRLLAMLPEGADLPFMFLSGAEVVVSKRHAPNSPVQAVERIVEEASMVKGTGPVVLPRYVEVFAGQLITDKLEAALVYEKPAFQHLLDAYAEEFEPTLESENLEAWVTERELPFALLVTDEATQKVAVVVYDDGGEIRGLITNDSREAYEWGHEQWKQYRALATEPSIETAD